MLASPAALLPLLGAAAVDRYETYVATAPFPAADYPDAREIAGRFVVENRDGEPVSWAWSISCDDRAAEVSVETVEAFRRRGYAAQVTAAWATRTLAAGTVPFYSHRAANVASAAVAARLELVHVFTVVTVE
jgi:predicted GNAT family acetyltransferase